MVHPLAKTVVIGAKGFIGSHFYRFYKKRDKEAIGTHHVPLPGYAHLDFSDFSLDFIEKNKPEYAVIAGGIANPKECEKDPKKTHFINVEKTLALAKALLEKDIMPILFSTDYVFDGNQDAYSEDAMPSPLNEYGRQKAELEKRIKEELSRYLLIRLSKVYGTEKGDGSLFDQMAASFSKNQKVFAAVDQILSPVHIDEVVVRTVLLQEEKKVGFFQFASNERISRYEYAKMMGEAFNKAHLAVPMHLDELEDRVKRPKKVFLKPSFSFSPAKQNIQILVQQYL